MIGSGANHYSRTPCPLESDVYRRQILTSEDGPVALYGLTLYFSLTKNNLSQYKVVLSFHMRYYTWDSLRDSLSIGYYIRDSL